MSKENNPSVAHIKACGYLVKHGVKRSSGIIPYPEVKRVLSWLFHFNKSESWEFIAELQSSKLIKRYPYHGILVLGDFDE